MIARISRLIPLLLGCTFATHASAQAPPGAGPFTGNPDVGTWTITTAQKTTPDGQRTTTHGTVENRVALNGWFMESESNYGGKTASKAFVTADAALKEFKFWYFVEGPNVFTTTGTRDPTTNTISATGTDQYGNTVSTTDRRVSEDKHELTLVVKTKTGVLMVDQIHTMERKKKGV